MELKSLLKGTEQAVVEGLGGILYHEGCMTERIYDLTVNNNTLKLEFD